MEGFATLLPLLSQTACIPSPVTTEEPVSESCPILNVTPTEDLALIPALLPNADGSNELTRLVEQGKVVFEVTPLNLLTPANCAFGVIPCHSTR